MPYTNKDSPASYDRHTEAIVAYGAALVEAEWFLDMYGRHTQGAYVWKAYRAWRKATEVFPAHRDACSHFETEETTSQRLASIGEKVLALLDDVAAEMVELGGITSPDGAAALRKALQLEDWASPAKAKSIELRINIINHFEAAITGLRQYIQHYSSWPEDVKAHARPPANRTVLMKEIAERFGCSVTHVRRQIDNYLREDPHGLSAEILPVLHQSESLTTSKPRRIKTQRKKSNTPAESHPWKQTIVKR